MTLIEPKISFKSKLIDLKRNIKNKRRVIIKNDS